VFFERGIDFHKAVINCFAGCVIKHFDHAEPFIHRLEQRAVALLAVAQCRLRRILLGHVVEHQHRPDDCTITIADGCATVGDGVLATVA